MDFPHEHDRASLDSSRILFEDNHLLIINKLPGEIVQGDKTGDHTLLDTVKEYIKVKYDKPGEVFLGLVHRIDRPVSGAVIFARTSKALSRMTVMIKDRLFKKTYLAITDNAPAFKEKELTGWLKKNEQQNKSFIVQEGTQGSKWASLTCTHVMSGKTLHLLQVDLHTGRHHQIRAQLAAAGLVIRGDVKYGARRANNDGSICLHAHRLQFNHPVGDKPLDIIAPLPSTPAWQAFSEIQRNLLKLLVFLFCFTMLTVQAQYFDIGQERASLKWQQLSASDFKVVYPDYYQANAIFTAATLNSWGQAISASLQTNTPFTPLLLHTRSTVSNAYTVWAPRRLEFLTIPPQDIYPQPWLEQLVLHEYRHIAQISKLNQGFTKGLGIVLGQQAIPAMIGLFVPPWFLEGDAVAAETALTSTGRGRVAGFHNPLKALLADKGIYSYPKAVLGSYKDFVPNHYVIGYHIVAAGRSLYGTDIWSSVLDRVARKPFTLNPFSKGIAIKGGGDKQKLYRHSMQYFDSLWMQQQIAENFNKLPIIPAKSYTSFRFPFASGNNIIALKTSLHEIPVFVKIDSTGNYSTIFTPGYLFDSDVSFNGSWLGWTEQRPHVRWETEKYVTILLLNPETGKTIKLYTESRVFAPVLNPANTTIAASEVTVQGNNFLSFFQFEEESGNQANKRNTQSIERVASPDNVFISSPSWSPDGTELAFIATSSNGKCIMRFMCSDSSFNRVTPWSHAEISRPQHLGDKIIFNADIDERSEVCLVELTTHSISRLTKSLYGTESSWFSSADNRLLFSFYTADGFRIGTLPLSHDTERIELSNANRWPVASILSEQEKSIGAILTNITNTDTFNISPYNKAAHLFHFHSWAPAYIDVNDQSLRPGFSLMSQNLLSTMFINAGYDYNLEEEAGTWRARLTYKGWFPEISALYEYGIRQATQGTGDTARHFRWGESSVSFRLGQQLNWVHGPYSSGLYAAVEPQATSFIHTPSTPATFIKGTAGSVNYWLSGYILRKTALRDIAPQWGTTLNVHFRHAPFGDFIPAPLFSVQSRLYLPGLFSNHSFQIYSALQTLSTSADGCKFSADNLWRIRPSYSFPIGYPDWNIGTTLYIKRFRSSLFHEVTLAETPPQPTVQYHSTGIDLISDFHLFSLPAPVTLGIRTAYLYKLGKPDFSLIFSFDLSQY